MLATSRGGTPLANSFLYRLDFAVGHLPFPTALATELACDFKVGTGPFDGGFSFHFSQAGHDMEEEATGCGAGVDGVSQAFELNSLFVEFTDEVYKVLNAAAEPVELPDNERVALA